VHSSIGHNCATVLSLLSSYLLSDCLVSWCLLSCVLTPSHFHTGSCCICRRAIFVSEDSQVK
jgi:hypothetical protein